jgi:hypothetical protein
MLGIGKHAINDVEAVIYTRLLVHFNDLSMPPTDERGGTYTVVEAGQNMTIVDPKFGLRCLHNNNGSGYFTPGPGVSFASAAEEPWCLEMWANREVYPGDATTTLVSVNATTHLMSINTYNTTVRGTDRTLSSYGMGMLPDFSGGSWVHLAFYRLSIPENTLCMALNGIVHAVSGISDPSLDMTDATRLYIGSGAAGPPGNTNFGGKLDALRYSVGTGRYGTSNFTPPAVPFLLD